LHTVLDGAWALLLGRSSGHEEVLFCTTVSGRDVDVPGIEELVGHFIYFLPLRVRIDEPMEIWAWMRALQAKHVEIREHQHLPLSEIRRAAGIPAENPLFRSMVVVENYPFDLSLARRAGIEVELSPGSNLNPFALMFGTMPGNELELSLTYDVSRFDTRSIHRMATDLAQLLRRMTEAPAPRLGELLASLDDARG
ncbi:MAG TPA: condensation domain-containing protein, partial [Candidatus Nanopelagicales bacterium]|nr:condensation domain-containing protein [Candidatus Nanopelagicales bacterium]